MPDEENPAAQRLWPEVVNAICQIHELEPDPEQFPETGEELLALAITSWEEDDELRERVLGLISTLRHVQDPLFAAGIVVREYMCEHADAIRVLKDRRICSDGFLRFVARMVEPGGPGEGLSVADLSYVSGVPVPMLEEWFHAPPGGNE